MRDGMGMPLEWASRLPAGSWTLAGIALLVGVSAPQAVSAVLTLTRHRRAGQVGVLAGALLVAWIVIQVVVLQRYFFLQPVIAVIGGLEIALAWISVVPKRVHVRAGSDTEQRSSR